MKNLKIEVEDKELFLVNEAGDKVIIPVNKAKWVKQKLSEGCHGCIDKLVETLPVMKDYAQDGSLLPDWDKVWDKVKATLNPKNWGVPDYTDKGTRGQAFAAARKAGEKEFMWNNKRFHTRQDTDVLNVEIPKNPERNPSNWTSETYSSYIQSNYPEFFKLINRGEGLNSIKFEGISKDEKDRGFYSRKENTIYVGENMDMTNPEFIGTIIAEMAHQKDRDKNKIWGSWDNDFFERRKYGEERYNIPNTLEYNTHRLYEPGLALIAYGDLSPNDIKRIQKHLGVKEDGFFGPITYKALQKKYENSEYIKQAIKEHNLRTQDKDINPVGMGTYSGLAKSYLHQLNQDVPLRDSRRFYDPLQDSDYTDNAMLNIIPESGNYDIKELQRALVKRGYKLPKSTKKDGTFDGVWGDETKNALLDYQSKNKTKQK